MKLARILTLTLATLAASVPFYIVAYAAMVLA